MTKVAGKKYAFYNTVNSQGQKEAVRIYIQLKHVQNSSAKKKVAFIDIPKMQI